MNWLGEKVLSVTGGKGGCTLSAKEEAFSDRNENCPFSACLNCPVSADICETMYKLPRLGRKGR